MVLFLRELILPKTLQKVPNTACTKSLWAHIREGLLLEGFLRLRFGGLIFWRAYFFWGGGGLPSEFYGIIV